MKKILLSAAAIALSLGAFAQQKRVCGTLEHEKFLDQQNPNHAKMRADYEQAIQNYIANSATQKNISPVGTQSVIQIPLVVHMVWNSLSDSVSDAQIFSQIQILNDDFTRANADKVNTPSTFTAAASAPMIQYCWAQRDPAGNPTTGIERRKSTTVTWTTDDKVKSYATGGLDAWDPSRYFNIWVCRLSSTLLGYGEFPTGSLSNTYGFVAQFSAFGNTGFATAPFNKGRTATHEIGHCFNLFHIWGDDGTACTGSDQCADTPNQAGENYNCPTYPHTDGCTTTSPGVMFMNYMDYTDDGCMNMFTINQSTRMNAVINTAPYNALLTSNACTPVTLVPLDAGITAVNAPAGLLCSTTINPVVTLKNWGSNTLTSCQVKYKIDAGTTQTYTWSGSLASLATTTVALPSMTTTAASHTFSANTASPNAGTDGNATNDLSTGTFTVQGGAGQALPYFEGFESTTFPQGGMTLNNADASTTWARTTVAKKTGLASGFMDYYNYTASGQIDEMVIPALDLTGGSSQQMTFQVAYQLYTSPTATLTYSDTLQVLVSTNCGASWSSVYKKFSTALTTATPAFSTTSFVPTANQWRLETIPLTSYVSPNTMIKIRGVNGYENQLYIDDINITMSTGVTKLAPGMGVTIYPNPSADGKFVVDIEHNQNNVNKLSVYDVLGNVVYSIDAKIPAGQYDMDLSNLSGGTYFVQVMKDNKPVFSKIVINK